MSAAVSKASKQESKGGNEKHVSVLDQPVTYSRDTGIRDYATRFLADELPESLRPTKDERRLQVALVWGRNQFVDVKDLSKGQSLTAGDGHGATFPVAHESLKGVVPLVQAQGDEFRVLLPAGAKATVRTGGQTVGIDKLQGGQPVDVPVKGVAYTIGLDDRVNIEFGNLELIARYTRPQYTTARPLGDRIDINFMTTVVILLLGAATMMAMFAITDFSEFNLSDDLFKNREMFAKYVAKIEEPPPPEQKFEDLSGVEEGAKAKDEEGKFGVVEAEQQKAAPSKEGAPVVDVDKREKDRQKVMNSGLLALLGDGAGGATSNVFGPGGIGTGLNDALGGIDGGAAMGDAQGVGGLGARGGGAGGGGTALGIGGLGGKGGGRGRGGTGSIDLGGTGKATTKFVPGKTTVVGGLNADEVGRVIRRNWTRFKYCYEKELQKDPNLAGKVSVYFEIGPVGGVALAQLRETTLQNATAEECILAIFRGLQFPAPRGGGVVNVTYPFIFTAG